MGKLVLESKTIPTNGSVKMMGINALAVSLGTDPTITDRKLAIKGKGVADGQVTENVPLPATVPRLTVSIKLPLVSRPARIRFDQVPPDHEWSVYCR